MAEGGDIPKEIPDFGPTDLDDDDDDLNIQMNPISSTTRLINPDDEKERPIPVPRKNTTTIDQGYLGYSEYMGERKRFQWAIKAEEKKPEDIRERDDKYERRIKAAKILKNIFQITTQKIVYLIQY